MKGSVMVLYACGVPRPPASIASPTPLPLHRIRLMRSFVSWAWVCGVHRCESGYGTLTFHVFAVSMLACVGGSTAGQCCSLTPVSSSTPPLPIAIGYFVD